MDTNPSTVTVWQSGRLAPHLASRRFEFEFGREQWLGSALLATSAVVLAIFVGVLERDVQRGELEHASQRGRAIAEARCESDRPADQRGGCLALFNDAVVTAQGAVATAHGSAFAAPDNARGTITASALPDR